MAIEDDIATVSADAAAANQILHYRQNRVDIVAASAGTIQDYDYFALTDTAAGVVVSEGGAKYIEYTVNHGDDAEAALAAIALKVGT